MILSQKVLVKTKSANLTAHILDFWPQSSPLPVPVSLQMPEMLHNDAGDHGFSHCGFFLLQNAGILLGFCIMLLIAIFEHHIQLDLGY